MLMHKYGLLCEQALTWPLLRPAEVSLCCPQAGGGEPAAYPGSQAVGAEGPGDPGERAGAETQPAEGHPTPGAAGEAAGVSPGVRLQSLMLKDAHSCTLYDIERGQPTQETCMKNMAVMVYNKLTQFLIDEL